MTKPLSLKGSGFVICEYRLFMWYKFGGISFVQPVYYMGITGCNLGVTVAERVLHKSQVLGFLV